jgi:hypothetical protein
VGDQIGVDWDRFELEQFRIGMDVEYEHGAHDPQTDVTGDDPILTGKIALAHMKEFPDYYERMEKRPSVSGPRAAALAKVPERLEDWISLIQGIRQVACPVHVASLAR